MVQECSWCRVDYDDTELFECMGCGDVVCDECLQSCCQLEVQ